MHLEDFSNQERVSQGGDVKNVIQLNESLLKDDVWPLIPEGHYLVSYSHHETKRLFKTPKVFVHFKIVDQGPYFGIQIFRAYRVNEIVGKERKNGRFKLKSRSELFLALCGLHDRKLRPDQISIRPLKNSLIKASVRTVSKDYKQRTLPECLRYSVVDKLIGLEVGSL